MKNQICRLSILAGFGAVAELVAQDALEPLVITGSSVLEPLKDTPVRTELVDEEVLQDRGIRSLAEAITYSPGLRVDSTCNTCNQQSIQMLGLPQQYIGILSDGLPNFSSLAGVYGIEQIPAALIGQIEIVKGGGSVLYGPGAVAGVINLVPRDPTVTGGQISGRILGIDEASFNTAPGGNAFGIYDYVSDDGTFKASLFGSWDRVQPIDVNGDGFTEVSERNLWTAGLRTTLRPNDQHFLSVEYFLSDEERRGGSGNDLSASPNLAVVAEEIFSRRQVVTTKWTADWNERWTTRLGYSFSRTDRDTYYGGIVPLGSPDPASPFFDPTWTPGRGFGDTVDDLHFLDASALVSLNEEHRFTFGTQYRHETIVDNQATVGRVLDERFTNFGFYAQHRYQPVDEWTFEYGARFDQHSDVDDLIFSPRAALLYAPRDDFRIRTAVSTGFRAPEIFDEDLHIANVGGELSATFNDPGLREESSTTLTISPEWQITDEWRVELNAFYTMLDDTFVIEPNDDPATANVLEFLRTNGESSDIYGAELNLGYFAEDWRLELSWVEQRLEYENRQLLLGDDTFADPADNPIFSSRYARTPESLGLLRFSHEAPWFDWYVTGRLTGPMDVPEIVSNPVNGNLVCNNLVRTGWFFNLDVGMSREFDVYRGTLTAALGVQNLLNDFQDRIQFGAYRDASFIYGPAFPRTFFASLRYEF